MCKIGINDVTVRDGNQSLLATRMEVEDIVQLVGLLDKVGFNALEVWGGATFDSAFRFLKTSAWDNLRKIRQAAKKTKLSMLLRGQNIVGYHHYDNDTLERFIRLTLENGIDIIRCFDALNDLNNLKNAFKFTKKHGGHLQAAIAYTVSPVHDNAYYVNLVRKFEEMGADSICIKDMAGIISPQNAYELTKAIKEVTDLPVDLHTHATANASAMVMQEAMRAGIDIVDGCISPFSGGTAHIADETLLEIAKLTGRDFDLNLEALDEAYNLANSLADKYIQSGDYRCRTLIPNPKILTYQVPGGMLSNLMSQLEQQKASSRLSEVLEEVPRVRKDLGYPPLVTPLSQMVGTQAVLNVLLGERYKMVPNEIKDYLQGFYGRAPGEINTRVKEQILKDQPKKELVAVDDIASAYESSKESLESSLSREAKEEEVVAYTIFPQQVEAYFMGQNEVQNSSKGAAGIKKTQKKQQDNSEHTFRLFLPEE